MQRANQGGPHRAGGLGPRAALGGALLTASLIGAQAVHAGGIQDHVPGFIALHDMEEELSSRLGGHAVDLVTERFLNRRIRDRVLAGAEIQYAAG